MSVVSGSQAPRATLYLDLSLSMVNFLDSRRPKNITPALDYDTSFQFGALTRRLPVLLRQNAQRFETAGFSVQGNRGKADRLIPKYGISDEQFRALTATECFANLSASSAKEACYSQYKNNLRTDFSGLFPDVQARLANGELVAVVSDLMSYNAGQLGDYNDVASPLTELIRQGYAVALLSAAVGYNGNVSDIPPPGIPLAGRMPFHTLIIGSSEQVAAVLRSVDADPGFRTFRQNHEKFWHAVLFDRQAGAGITLGKPAPVTPPQGVLTTGNGLVNAGDFVGQFVVARSDDASRTIHVQWPVAQPNPLVPVEYEIAPNSELWMHTGGGSRCEDGWQSVNDPSLRPDAKAVALASASEPARQSLFTKGVPFQMASRITYLWRLNWKPSATKLAAGEERFLSAWSANAATVPALRARFTRSRQDGLFPTFDLEALYRDLWQAAYGTGATGAPPLSISTYLAAIVQ